MELKTNELMKIPIDICWFERSRLNTSIIWMLPEEIRVSKFDVLCILKKSSYTREPKLYVDLVISHNYFPDNSKSRIDLKNKITFSLIQKFGYRIHPWNPSIIDIPDSDHEIVYQENLNGTHS
jgi:hypothetical protein